MLYSFELVVNNEMMPVSAVNHCLVITNDITHAFALFMQKLVVILFYLVQGICANLFLCSLGIPSGYFSPSRFSCLHFSLFSHPFL